MIKIGRSWLNYLLKEEQLDIGEFSEKYHITEMEFQFNSLEDQGYDVAFEDPKYETIFKIKFGL